MKKESKKLLLSSLATLSTLSVATPLMTLSSCGNNEGVSDTAAGVEYDRAYAIDESTYTRVKGDFISEFNLYAETIEDETQRKQEIETFHKAIKKFDDTFAANSKEYSYSVRTEALMNYAELFYGFKLKRNRTANMSDINNVFIGAKKSVDSYMDANDFPDKLKEFISSQAKSRFDELISELTQRKLDPLSMLIIAKKELAHCYADLNYDISLMASASRLSNFLKTRVITFKDSIDTNKLDLLENSPATDPDTGETVYFKEGADIAAFMNRIFNIEKVESKLQRSNETFNRRMLPGYVLSPKLKSITRDPLKNEYALNIDWTCCKDNYRDGTEKAPVAHVYESIGDVQTLEDAEELQSKSIADVLDDENNASTVSYALPLTAEKEQSTVKDTYFAKVANGTTKTALELKWDDPLKCAYDAFFHGTKDESYNDGNLHYIIDQNALTASGLMLAEKNLTTNETSEFIRLDQIGDWLETRSEDESAEETLIHQFMSNCSLCADVTIYPNSPTRQVDVNLYVQYNNSTVKTYLWNEPKTLTNFALSEQSYKDLTVKFNEVWLLFRNYEKNVFQLDINNEKTAQVLTSVFFTITTLLNAATIVSCIFGIKSKIPLKVAIILLSLADEAFSGYEFFTYLFKKWIPTKKYALGCEKLKQTNEYTELKNMLDADRAKYHFVLADEKTHVLSLNDVHNNYVNYYRDTHTDFLRDTLPDIERYNNIVYDPTLIKFEDKMYEYGISMSQYGDEMEPWSANGKYTKILGWNTLASFVIATAVITLSIIDGRAQRRARATAQQVREGAQQVGRESINATQETIDESKALTVFGSETKGPKPKAKVTSGAKGNINIESIPQWEKQAFSNDNKVLDEFTEHINQEKEIFSYRNKAFWTSDRVIAEGATGRYDTVYHMILTFERSIKSNGQVLKTLGKNMTNALFHELATNAKILKGFPQFAGKSRNEILLLMKDFGVRRQKSIWRAIRGITTQYLNKVERSLGLILTKWI